MPKEPIVLPSARARAIWLRAQRLDSAEPFGTGPDAVREAIRHLGYVQIDTINVIERCHHHILFSRIPTYRREHLATLQSVEKSVFEYWTHALSYVPSEDIPFFVPLMKAYRANPSAWFGSVTNAEVRAMVRRLNDNGPLSIRDIDDDELVEKNHPWGSRKPSKRVLQLMFYQGHVAISAREGMLKTYDLTGRHFGWEKPPRPATERQVTAYLLDRALRSQGIVSLDSICHLNAPAKKPVRELIEARVKRRLLVPVRIKGAEAIEHWAEPETLAANLVQENRVHILSPFDPLIIQRKRLKLFFGYEHLFEAYLPSQKRRLGYFALPVLRGDEVIAAIDLKTDRAGGRMLVQNWTWFGDSGAEAKADVDAELTRFEAFQLAR